MRLGWLVVALSGVACEYREFECTREGERLLTVRPDSECPTDDTFIGRTDEGNVVFDALVDRVVIGRARTICWYPITADLDEDRVGPLCPSWYDRQSLLRDAFTYDPITGPKLAREWALSEIFVSCGEEGMLYGSLLFSDECPLETEARILVEIGPLYAADTIPAQETCVYQTLVPETCNNSWRL